MFMFVNKISKSNFYYLINVRTLVNSSFTNSLDYDRQIGFSKTYSTTERDDQFDIAIVGAGIVGLGTALELKKRLPDYSMCVIDKEPYVAAHQSSRNSGVIHAGIYYKPGSLKAKLCVDGMHLMYKYCEENEIPYKRNGKLIIAVNEREVKWMEDLYVRGIKNKVPGLEVLEPKQFKEIEPHMVGLKALYSPYTGIVKFGEVAEHYGKQFRCLGGTIILNFKVTDFCESAEGDGLTHSGYPVTIVAEDGRTIKAGFVLTCGGLHADRLAMMSGESPYPKIMPFRGEYFLLNPEKNHMVKGNVYPVPDPSMPFIGVHFTPKLDGSVWCGPTAMLAYKREGYNWSKFDLGDVWDMVTFRGMHRFVYKHFRMCLYELQRSLITRVMLKELQLYMPTLKLKDITPGASAGVQAQAMNNDGSFPEDFGFKKTTGRILHCRSAPSPAATSSLAIANHLASLVQSHL